MDLDTIRTFLCVARSAGYTSAARELDQSQSAIWRQMRRLEHELGSPLFDQIGKTLQLTHAGELFQREANALVAQFTRLNDTLRDVRGGARGRLRIGASSTPGRYLLPPIVGAFMREHPAIELRYDVGNTADVERLVLANQLDVGFVGGLVRDPELVSQKLFDDEIVTFAAPSHALAHKRGVQPRDLASELCVIREHGSATRAAFEAWLARERVTLDRTLEVASPETLKLLVASGVGFSFLSRRGVAAEAARGEVRIVDVHGPRLTRPIYMIRHASKYVTPLLQDFIRRVAESDAAPARRTGRR